MCPAPSRWWCHSLHPPGNGWTSCMGKAAGPLILASSLPAEWKWSILVQQTAVVRKTYCKPSFIHGILILRFLYRYWFAAFYFRDTSSSIQDLCVNAYDRHISGILYLWIDNIAKIKRSWKMIYSIYQWAIYNFTQPPPPPPPPLNFHISFYLQVFYFCAIWRDGHLLNLKCWEYACLCVLHAYKHS